MVKDKPEEQCDWCGHRAEIGTDVAIYLMPVPCNAVPLCRDFTGRNCAWTYRERYYLISRLHGKLDQIEEILLPMKEALKWQSLETTS